MNLCHIASRLDLFEWVVLVVLYNLTQLGELIRAHIASQDTRDDYLCVRAYVQKYTIYYNGAPVTPVMPLYPQSP